MIYTYEYPRPMVTTDILVVSCVNSITYILLIKRRNNPYRDFWAIPGGFVDENESLIDAARRELHEETGIAMLDLEQFYTFGDPGRDPRGHCISVVFVCYVPNKIVLKAGDDAKCAKWFDINKLPSLAFDHQQIINQFFNKVKKNCPE